MSPGEWIIGLGISIAIALLLLPIYSDISLWIGLVLILATLTAINMASVSNHLVPYPHVAILIACIQLTFAAWGNWHYPLDHPIYDIGESLPNYLSFVGPACFLFAAGLIIGFGAIRLIAYENTTIIESPIVTGSLIQELNALIIAGVAATFLQGHVPAGLNFVMVLLSNLAFIGAFGFLLLKIPGWKLRLAIVMAILIQKTLQEGMFHDLIIWSASLILILAYSRQWDRKRIFSIIIAGVISILVIINVKQEYRNQFWFGKTYIAKNRVVALSTLVANILSNPEVLISNDKMPKVMQRLNQGWIVNRAMRWTPQREPYAEGKTFLNNFIETLIPRFLYPEKGEVGGRKDYERYTGLVLQPGTSMALGYAGEMYVNFGPYWGILGVGLYGLLIGMGFHWFYVRAIRNPLWWAWASYFACMAIKAESSIGYATNWLFKSAIIMVVVLFISPEMRQALAPRMPGVRIKL